MSAAGSAPAASTGRARPSWRRRLLRWAMALVALRLLLALLLTPLLELALGATGLDARLGASRLALFAGRLELDLLVLRPTGALPPSFDSVVMVRGIEADLDLSALLGGTLRVETLRVDDALVSLQRGSDGRWPLLDALAGEPSARTGPVEPAERDEPDERGAPSLAPPIEIESLVVHPLRLQVTHQAAGDELPVPLALEATLRVQDLVAGRPASVELRVTGSAVDQLRLDATAQAEARQLRARMQLGLAGLRPALLGPLLEVAGLRPSAGLVEGSLSLELRASVSDAPAPVLAGSLRVDGAGVSADGREALSLDHLEVPLESLGPGGVRLGQVVVQGLRAALGRRADGALAWAGFAVLPGAPAPDAPDAPDAPAAGSPRGDAQAFALAGLSVRDAACAWSDDGTTPPGRLELALDELALGALDSASDAPVALRCLARAPGLVERVALEGTFTPLGPRPGADLALQLGGLQGKALDPWLAAAGWAADLREATLAAGVSAAFEREPSGLLRGAGALRDLVLSDGRELLRLAAVELQEVELDPAGGLHVGAARVDGPVLAVQRTADGTWHVPGLRSVPVVPRRPPAASAAAAAPASPPGDSGPRVSVGAFTWEGAALAIRDDAVTPDAELTVSPRAQAEDLGLGGAEGPSGRLALSVAAPGAWGALELQAELRALDRPADLGASVVLALSDLHAAVLGGWLAAAGLQADDLHAGLRAALDVQVRGGDDARTDLVLSDLAWTDGDATPLALPRVALLGLRSTAEGTRLERLDVAPADVRLRRDAAGVLAFGGLRLVGAPADATGQASAPSPGPAAPAPPQAPAASFALDRLELPRLTLHWSDASVAPAVELPVEFTLQVEELVAGADAPPGRFALALRAPGVCEPLGLTGSLALPPDGVALQAELHAAGVRLDPLSAYLPPGVESALQDGRLAARLALSAGPAAAGGRALDLRLSGLDWREAGAPEPLAALGALRFHAPRLDASGGVLQVDEVSLSGLALQAERRPDGALAALGLLLRPDPAGASPAVAPAAAGAPARPARPAALPVKDLRIERVDLALGPLRWLDASGPQPGAPLVMNARLSAPEPLVVLDRRLDDLPPVRLELRADAAPLVRALEADVFLDASAARPGLRVDLRASGLRGAGLTEVQPALAATLDGSGLSDGALTANLQAELQWPRRGPLDFDVSGGLSGDVVLSGVALRAVPDGEPLLGLQRLAVDIEDLRPGSGALHLSSVELDGMLARLGWAADGLTVGGVRLIPPPEPPRGGPEAADAPPPPPAPPAPPGPPLRIDLVSASGLDLLVRDETCTPPLLLPLRDLELELRGYSRDVQPAPPLRLVASLRGGEIELPVRHKASSLLAGVVGATTRAIGGGGDAVTLERRRVFDEIALQGRVEPGPAPRGWLNLSLSAVELQALAGPAARSGVIIGDGTLDATARLRLRGADGISAETSLTFGSLSLSEPANGPITRWLKLPAPLDTVLFLLKNEDGEQVFATSFEAPAGSLGTGRLARAAVGALGSVIGRAVASSPMRLVGTVTDLAGLTGGEEDLAPEPPLVLGFAAGDPLPPQHAAALLAPLARRLAQDDELAVVVEHAFGGGDAERALVLASPPADDALALAQRLRLLRDERLRARDQLAAEARALHAVGQAAAAADFTARVAAEDRVLGGLEASLDRALALLDSGAERRAPRRARAVALEFGEARLQHVRRLLSLAGGADLVERVELRPVRYQPGPGAEGGTVSLTVKPRPSGGGFFDWLFGWIPDLFGSDPEPAPEG